MIRPECSYTLTLKGTDRQLAQAFRHLESEGIVPDYLTPDPDNGQDDDIHTYMVPEGSMGQTDIIFDAAHGLSSAIPGLDVELIEACEEIYTPEHLARYRNGELIMDQYSRIVPCEEPYDRITMDTVLHVLSKNGHQDAIDCLTQHLAIR